MNRLIIPLLVYIIGGTMVISSCRSKKNGTSFSESHEYLLRPLNEVDKKTTTITFLNATIFNFGNIRAGDTVVQKFFFKNTGTLPLIISSASPTCGCTVAYFNKKPIEVGNTDSIVATFISTPDMIGFQNKVVTVTCNSTISPFLLTLYGRVK